MSNIERGDRVTTNGFSHKFLNISEDVVGEVTDIITDYNATIGRIGRFYTIEFIIPISAGVTIRLTRNLSKLEVTKVEVKQ